MGNCQDEGDCCPDELPPPSQPSPSLLRASEELFFGLGNWHSLPRKFEFPVGSLAPSSDRVQGQLMIAPGLYYSGGWAGKRPQGRGVMTQLEKWRFVGFFRQGVPDIYGRFYDFEDLELYEGQVARGKYEGKGVLVKGQASQFVGLFRNGEQTEGLLRYKDGSQYRGRFVNGLREDKSGYFRYKDGSEYVGEFKGDGITGKGRLVTPGGQKYFGQFLDHMKHGEGEFFWPDGSYYRGEYARGLKHGKGMFRWSNGKSYKGGFRNGQMHGTGVVEFQDWKARVKYEMGKLVGEEELSG